MNRMALLLAVTMAAVSLPSMAETNFPPKLSDRGRKAYAEKYEPASQYKAFAITRDGRKFSWVHSLPSSERAARTASLRCLATHGVPCVVWMVNNEETLSLYDKAAGESEKAVALLPAELQKKAFGGEDNDLKVSPPSTLRDGAVIHSATPLEAPTGTRIIATSDLVGLYRTQPGLVVLDSLHDSAVKKQTLPKAAWLHGAGWSQSEQNGAIDANLAKAMAVLAPGKDTPVVSYCLSWECWLSWNAAMRLAAMGYTQVYWYRGGMESWKAARLPVIETPITAQLW